LDYTNYGRSNKIHSGIFLGDGMKTFKMISIATEAISLLYQPMGQLQKGLQLLLDPLHH
jgi:hypothetical protein